MNNRHLMISANAALLTVLLITMTAVVSGCQGAPPRISIENARAELSPALYGEGLVYLTIKNDGGKDTLTGVRVNLPGARADLHEMRSGLMVVSRKMIIPAQSIVVLRPAESHIMIENMPKDVKEGSRIILTLIFERSGEKQVQLTLTKAQMPMTHEHRM